MNAKRARAYGRVTRILRDAPRGAIAPEQQRALREAADELVFAEAYDESVRRALAEARRVLTALRRPEHDPWVDQLATDLEGCGPFAGHLAVTPAVGPIASVVVPQGLRRADS
jgi:hypothetical protein